MRKLGLLPFVGYRGRMVARMSEKSVSEILESIRALDEFHYKWILEQIKQGEQESDREDLEE